MQNYAFLYQTAYCKLYDFWLYYSKFKEFQGHNIHLYSDTNDE